ncbi:Cyclic nucleotide-gated channel [Melia azedarach]|uniref:Cyclic nucleotide-gated channel n=1 Tax=Melia azedarach TaxID=155640 RepID=A0ACC1XLW5_MELAZ|nr:Cyclic nucleotide-gated channel [Melia azedarach]
MQVLGASWYLLSIQQQHDCFLTECDKERNTTGCNFFFLDCSVDVDLKARDAWLKVTKVLSNCDAKHVTDGVKKCYILIDVGANTVFDNFVVCSSYGQNLQTTTSIGETLFCILISISGLVLFSYLIGKMQTYVESTTAKLEEWRVRKRDTEEWMRHRQLPEELRDRVRRFVQYKWLATRGVDEDSILQSLPLDLKRQIQRHLCLAYVRRVPLFAQMDQQLLDAICERLYSSLNTKDTYLIREGDPVNEMFFIIRGQVESSTTNGGRTAFFNSITLKTGDFCGEELLTWALMTVSTLNLPLSTRTIKSLTEVEAFALRAEDLKFVASQFKRLHSKRLQHAFRYYSHQWKAWGASFIQAAWRRYMRKKAALLLAMEEGLYDIKDEECSIHEASGETNGDIGGGRSAVENANASNAPDPASSILSSKFNTSSRRALSLRLAGLDPDDSSLKMPKLFKPRDPDFSTDH